MKRFPFLSLFFLVAAGMGVAAEGATDDVAKTRAAYPTPNCVVSGERLEAGKVVEYVYKEEGKPDRLVRLCCHKCETRFKANPAKYLEKLDAAAAARAAKKN
jgi:hypothetical protein